MSAATATTVQGQRYQFESAATRTIHTAIFIEEYSLNISDDGGVFGRMFPRLAATKAMFEAAEKEMQQYQGRILTKETKGGEAANEEFEGLPTDQEMERAFAHVDAVREAADEAALTPVQVSRDLVVRIKTLYERSIHAITPQSEVRYLVAEIKHIVRVSGLFST